MIGFIGVVTKSAIIQINIRMEWYESVRRLRILFQIDEINYRFYWFEFKDNNLFWGSSSKKHNKSTIEPLNLSSDRKSCTITIDPNITPQEIISSKFSYHQSGQIHIKDKELNGIESYNYKSKWLKPCDINSPKLIFAIYSLPICKLGIFSSNLNKNRTFAHVLKYDKKYINSRCIFEFYLSPPGTFKTEDFIIKKYKESIKTYSLNKNLILVYKNLILNPDDQMNSWHPDCEIILFRGDLE